MGRPAVLEELKNLTVLKFTRDRDGGGAKATIRLPADDRQTHVWWRNPPKSAPLILHFRPYPDGWARLTPAQQAEASKDALVAILTQSATSQKASRATERRRPKSRRS